MGAGEGMVKVRVWVRTWLRQAPLQAHLQPGGLISSPWGQLCASSPRTASASEQGVKS